MVKKDFGTQPNMVKNRNKNRNIGLLQVEDDVLLNKKGEMLCQCKN